MTTMFASSHTLRSVAARSIAPLFLITTFAAFATATLVVSSAAHAKPPGEWTCEEGFYEDGTCDCGCGALDPDCTMATFEGCVRSGCGAGKVPWEHATDSCMTSVCGDGWKDEAMGEVCDDGDALASGGCSANCKSVNQGYTCGERADKCTLIPSEEPGPEPVEPAESSPEVSEAAAEPVTGEAEGGGCAGGAFPALGSLLLLGFARRANRTRSTNRVAPRA